MFLSAIAARTKRVRLVTGAVIPAFHQALVVGRRREPHQEVGRDHRSRAASPVRRLARALVRQEEGRLARDLRLGERAQLALADAYPNSVLATLEATQHGLLEAAALFDEKGHWIEMPQAWADPDASLDQKQFFQVLEDCLEKLPAKTWRTSSSS